MRATRKQIELAAITLFARALEERGIPPIHAPEVTDRPDAVFLIDNRPVAVECRYLSRPELVKLLAPNTWPTDHVYEVLLPVEPHLWVRDAITDKQRSVSAYMDRTGAQAAWLLLHSSHQHEILRDDRAEGTEFFELLRLGAHLTKHSFEQIWIAEVATDTPRAVCIFEIGATRPEVNFENYRARRSPYPLDRFWFANAMIRSSDGAEKHIKLNLNDLAVKPVCIQPLDENYRIHYDQLLSDPDRNANLRNLHYKIWDGRPKF